MENNEESKQANEETVETHTDNSAADQQVFPETTENNGDDGHEDDTVQNEGISNDPLPENNPRPVNKPKELPDLEPEEEQYSEGVEEPEVEEVYVEVREKSNSDKLIWAIVGILLLALIGWAYWYFTNKNKNENGTSVTEENPQTR